MLKKGWKMSSSRSKLKNKLFIVVVLFISSCSYSDSIKNQDNKIEQEPEIQSDDDGMVLVHIPKGPFIMGSYSDDAYYDEIPEHEVNLDEYWIDKFEVTNAQYSLCVEAGFCTIPQYDSGHYFDPVYSDHPIVYVAWDQAREYCKWTGRELPTEAQWEKAARGIEGRTYPWGDDEPSLDLANYLSVIKTTTIVGSYPDGASNYGVMDMAGNVWEWVNDWYDDSYYYETKNLSINPQGPIGGESHVIKGGAFNSSPWVLRSSTRMQSFGDPISRDVGFRCVLNSILNK